MSPEQLQQIAQRAGVRLDPVKATTLARHLEVSQGTAMQDTVWTAADRARMCGCGHPEQHTDDRTEQW